MQNVRSVITQRLRALPAKFRVAIRSFKMKTDIHPLVQNANDFDVGRTLSIIDEVGSDSVFQISISNICIPAFH